MNNVFKISALLLITLLIGCSSDDSENPETDAEATKVDLKTAFLDDFKLSEVAYTDIDLTQPEIVDEKEKTPGKIVITVPATVANLNLSLASVNFDKSKFEISPAVESVQSFENGNSVNYTITSKEDASKSIHYAVSVIKEKVEFNITGFKFEKSKNNLLSSDIEATKIVEYKVNNSNAIYVFVPVGTDLTALIPTINFEGESLEYKQGGDAYKTYPTTDLKINFKSDYNKLNFTDNNELTLLLKSSGLSKLYRVIVDVESPISFKESSVTTPDIAKGTVKNIKYKWVNNGNHPVWDRLDASEFVDNTTDKKGNIFSATLRKITTPTSLDVLIMPGEEGDVIVTVTADDANVNTGDYDTGIVFTPKYDVNRAVINDIEDDLNPIEDIFTPVTLNVKATIISN
ncbi:hypothetical protein [Flavivirga eckloniae]|uniref:Uncharacterized protein n=1 Tax=Flavivirga eckloniae TaxID=1803846 RepID=A0A2K9PKZ9_9FLAO|nr:hypothetical protein [Flavivirga eckloniae]AUP77749.1 hypothetical protein C1H87_03065 [Flavivirga eckloniae]